MSYSDEESSFSNSAAQNSVDRTLFHPVVLPVFTSKLVVGSQNGVKCINQYIIGKHLGEGTYGRVFAARRASDAPDTWPLAVKIFSRHLLARMATHIGTGIDLIRREFEVHAYLQSGGWLPRSLPALIEVIDDGEFRYSYAIMTNHASTVLRGALGADGGYAPDPWASPLALPSAVARKLTRDLVLALRFMHCSGIAHRDVKPANIMLDTLFDAEARAGGTEDSDSAPLSDECLPGCTVAESRCPLRAVLIDFGVAHAFFLDDPNLSTGSSKTPTDIMDGRLAPLSCAALVQLGMLTQGSNTENAFRCLYGAPPSCITPTDVDSGPAITVGTAMFQPPEVHSHRMSTSRSVWDCDVSGGDRTGALMHDAWSLGVVVYSWIFGHLPFTAASLPALQRRLNNAQLELPAGTDPVLADFLSGLLAPTIQRRLTVSAAAAHPWLTEGGKHMPALFSAELRLPYNDSRTVTAAGLASLSPPRVTLTVPMRSSTRVYHDLILHQAGVESLQPLGRARALLHRRHSMSDLPQLRSMVHYFRRSRDNPHAPCSPPPRPLQRFFRAAAEAHRALHNSGPQTQTLAVADQVLAAADGILSDMEANRKSAPQTDAEGGRPQPPPPRPDTDQPSAAAGAGAAVAALSAVPCSTDADRVAARLKLAEVLLAAHYRSSGAPPAAAAAAAVSEMQFVGDDVSLRGSYLDMAYLLDRLLCARPRALVNNLLDVIVTVGARVCPELSEKSLGEVTDDSRQQICSVGRSSESLAEESSSSVPLASVCSRISSDEEVVPPPAVVPLLRLACSESLNLTPSSDSALMGSARRRSAAPGSVGSSFNPNSLSRSSVPSYSGCVGRPGPLSTSLRRASAPVPAARISAASTTESTSLLRSSMQIEVPDQTPRMRPMGSSRAKAVDACSSSFGAPVVSSADVPRSRSIPPRSSVPLSVLVDGFSLASATITALETDYGAASASMPVARPVSVIMDSKNTVEDLAVLPDHADELLSDSFGGVSTAVSVHLDEMELDHYATGTFAFASSYESLTTQADGADLGVVVRALMGDDLTRLDSYESEFSEDIAEYEYYTYSYSYD